MISKPILFSGPMVQAILDGRKTMTQRVITPQPDEDGLAKVIDGPWTDTSGREYKSPYDAAYLWVRETWQDCLSVDGVYCVFGADYNNDEFHSLKPWKPSIHMPRRCSRLTLKVESIRVERLQDISEEDALAEGIDEDGEVFNLSQNILDNLGVVSGATHDIPKSSPAVAEFKHLWDSINGKRPDCSWEDNPWVWVVTFSPILENIDNILEE